MSDYFHQFDSRLAGESFFAFLCARPFWFAVHTRRRSMRLRSTSSPARRFAVEVSLSSEALAYVPAFAAERGFWRFLRAANLPERVGAQPGVLRSTRALGHRFSARLQTRRERRWFVASFAATRGDLSRPLRADEGLQAGVAGSSTLGSGRRFRNGRLSLRRGVFSHHSAATNQGKKTANNGAAANGSARHGSCYSRSLPSRAVVAFSHVRCLSLRSTCAATAPRSAVAELESLGVITRSSLCERL